MENSDGRKVAHVTVVDGNEAGVHAQEKKKFKPKEIVLLLRYLVFLSITSIRREVCIKTRSTSTSHSFNSKDTKNIIV